MALPPGGFAWLLRHELRLALRGTGTRRGWFARNAPIVLLATVPTIGGVLLAWSLRGAPALPASHMGLVRNYLDVAVLGLLVLMVSTASIAVLRTFYDRHDLDLLLSAPVPPARVLAAKAVGVAVTVAAPFLLFTAPFLIASAVFGHPGWLGGLVMVAVDAVLATAIATALIGALSSAVGPARARTVAQLGAALVGGTVFLASQMRNVAPALADRLGGLIATRWPAPLDWPARAVLGEVVPLLALAVVAVAAAWGSAGIGARHLAASGDTASRTVRARAGPVRFGGGLARIVVAKELRLIARDPELITQIGLRLVYLIPLGALVLRGDHGIDASGVAGAATACAGLLASSLAWIVVCAEDAPDLLAAAPVPAAAIRRAKLAAACIVPLGVVAVAAAGLAPVAPVAAAVTLAMGSVAALTAALLQAWFGVPQPRAAFRRRQSGSFVVGVGEILMAGAWSGTAALAARGSLWAVAPALLGTMIVAGAVEARRERERGAVLQRA